MTWERWDCERCGVPMQVPKSWMDDKRKSKADFYCINGHNWSYKESEADRIRRERDRAKQQEARWRQEAEDAKRRESAAKGQVTKLRNRVKNGVCPCCNRSFANLQRHMKSKHPDWDTSKVAAE